MSPTSARSSHSTLFLQVLPQVPSICRARLPMFSKVSWNHAVSEVPGTGPTSRSCQSRHVICCAARTTSKPAWVSASPRY